MLQCEQYLEDWTDLVGEPHTASTDASLVCGDAAVMAEVMMSWASCSSVLYSPWPFLSSHYLGPFRTPFLLFPLLCWKVVWSCYSVPPSEVGVATFIENLDMKLIYLNAARLMERSESGFCQIFTLWFSIIKRAEAFQPNGTKHLEMRTTAFCNGRYI